MTAILPGWPCALLASDPPSVLDKQSAPSAADLLPQLLQLTPRGPAWGADEAGDGKGASPVQLQFWTAIAGWCAASNATDFELASQALPSAVSWSLADWELEYGLPDPCTKDPGGQEQRIAALRGKYGAIGGQSPAYFICLAASLGYEVTVEEPTQFICDTSECDGDDEVSDETVWKFWIVHVATESLTWFTCDESECDFDPLEGFIPATDLECRFRALCPPHTQLIFDYTFYNLDFSDPDHSGYLPAIAA